MGSWVTDAAWHGFKVDGTADVLLMVQEQLGGLPGHVHLAVLQGFDEDRRNMGCKQLVQPLTLISRAGEDVAHGGGATTDMPGQHPEAIDLALRLELDADVAVAREMNLHALFSSGDG